MKEGISLVPVLVVSSTSSRKHLQYQTHLHESHSKRSHFQKTIFAIYLDYLCQRGLIVSFLYWINIV